MKTCGVRGSATIKINLDREHISQDDNVYELQEILECCKNMLGVQIITDE